MANARNNRYLHSLPSDHRGEREARGLRRRGLELRHGSWNLKQLTPPKSHPGAGEIRTSAMIINYQQEDRHTRILRPLVRAATETVSLSSGIPGTRLACEKDIPHLGDVDCFVFWTKDARPAVPDFSTGLTGRDIRIISRWTVTPTVPIWSRR